MNTLADVVSVGDLVANIRDSLRATLTAEGFEVSPELLSRMARNVAQRIGGIVIVTPEDM